MRVALPTLAALLLVIHVQAQTPRPERLSSVGLFFGGAGHNPYAPDFTKDQRDNAQKLKTAAIGQIVAAQEARNQAAAVGAEARVVAFLEERIANGSIDARYDLGLRKLTGRGVETNIVAGRQLIAEAASLGHSEASQWLAKNPEPPKKPEASRQ